VPGRLFIYVVEDVEEELTTFQRSDALHVAMGKQPSSRDIRGEPKISVAKEFARCLLLLL